MKVIIKRLKQTGAMNKEFISKMLWIYEEEQKCLDEMAKYPIEAKAEDLRRKRIEKVLNNLFTFECEEV